MTLFQKYMQCGLKNIMESYEKNFESFENSLSSNSNQTLRMNNLEKIKNEDLEKNKKLIKTIIPITPINEKLENSKENKSRENIIQQPVKTVELIKSKLKHYSKKIDKNLLFLSELKSEKLNIHHEGNLEKQKLQIQLKESKLQLAQKNRIILNLEKLKSVINNNDKQRIQNGIHNYKNELIQMLKEGLQKIQVNEFKFQNNYSEEKEMMYEDVFSHIQEKIIVIEQIQEFEVMLNGEIHYLDCILQIKNDFNFNSKKLYFNQNQNLEDKNKRRFVIDICFLFFQKIMQLPNFKQLLNEIEYILYETNFNVNSGFNLLETFLGKLNPQITNIQLSYEKYCIENSLNIENSHKLIENITQIINELHTKIAKISRFFQNDTFYQLSKFYEKDDLNLKKIQNMMEKISYLYKIEELIEKNLSSNYQNSSLKIQELKNIDKVNLEIIYRHKLLQHLKERTQSLENCLLQINKNIMNYDSIYNLKRNKVILKNKKIMKKIEKLKLNYKKLPNVSTLNKTFNNIIENQSANFLNSFNNNFPNSYGLGFNRKMSLNYSTNKISLENFKIDERKIANLNLTKKLSYCQKKRFSKM